MCQHVTAKKKSTDNEITETEIGHEVLICCNFSNHSLWSVQNFAPFCISKLWPQLDPSFFPRPISGLVANPLHSVGVYRTVIVRNLHWCTFLVRRSQWRIYFPISLIKAITPLTYLCRNVHNPIFFFGARRHIFTFFFYLSYLRKFYLDKKITGNKEQREEIN